MTALTASQILGAYPGHRDPRPGTLDALRELLRRLASGRQRGHTLAALPGSLLRDIGLDGVDLRGL